MNECWYHHSATDRQTDRPARRLSRWTEYSPLQWSLHTAAAGVERSLASALPSLSVCAVPQPHRTSLADAGISTDFGIRLRINYCNALVHGAPTCTIWKLHVTSAEQRSSKRQDDPIVSFIQHQPYATHFLHPNPKYSTRKPLTDSFQIWPYHRSVTTRCVLPPALKLRTTHGDIEMCILLLLLLLLLLGPIIVMLLLDCSFMGAIATHCAAVRPPFFESTFVLSPHHSDHTEVNCKAPLASTCK